MTYSVKYAKNRNLMNIIYPLHYLNDTEFENLTVDVCMKLLGLGTFRFAQGADGGRDGRFNGTAQKFPSSASPWSGPFIIQAKHTTNGNSSCADSQFDSILEEEIPKVKKLHEAGECENYILFTNRKGSANKITEIETRIKTETSVSNVAIVYLETLNSYLKELPDVVKRYQLDRLAEPLRFYEVDICNVIKGFKGFSALKVANLEEATKAFKFISKEKKNELNDLSKEYFQFITKHSLSYFSQIEAYLKDPANEKFADDYQNTVSELNSKVIEKRSEYLKFEAIINYLYDYILNKDETMKSERKLVLVFLHFMYFNCDLGLSE